MDCDLDSVDAYLISQCEAAEYCVVNEVLNGTEYIVRIGERVYVMIIPEDVKPKYGATGGVGEAEDAMQRTVLLEE